MESPREPTRQQTPRMLERVGFDMAASQCISRAVIALRL
jgi:hypothetical protein